MPTKLVSESPVSVTADYDVNLSESPVSITAQVEHVEVSPLVLPAAVRRRLGVRATPRLRFRAAASIGTALAVVAAVALHAFAPLANNANIVDLPWAVMGAGFAAQLVDGSLGMGYGITSASVLQSAAGLTPAMASSAVHLAQLGTTAVSGYSHWRCGNVHEATLHKLTPSGVLGALLGSTLLSSLATSTSKLVSSSMLLAVGAYVLVRFGLVGASSDGTGAAHHRAPRLAFLGPLGLVGGCIDAMGGGGWGPVATSGLLAEGRLPPSAVIGTVSLSEFFVTVAAVLGFLVVLGPSHAAAGAMRVDLALALLVGGLAAAPVAPHLVRRVEPRRLGMLVGAFICATNVKVLSPVMARVL